MSTQRKILVIVKNNILKRLLWFILCTLVQRGGKETKSLMNFWKNDYKEITKLTYKIWVFVLKTTSKLLELQLQKVTCGTMQSQRRRYTFSSEVASEDYRHNQEHSRRQSQVLQDDTRGFSQIRMSLTNESLQLSAKLGFITSAQNFNLLMDWLVSVLWMNFKIGAILFCLHHPILLPVTIWDKS